MAVLKSEMVSVRVGPHVKAALQDAAVQEVRSVANMVEVMVLEYCRNRGYSSSAHSPTSEGGTVLRGAGGV